MSDSLAALPRRRPERFAVERDTVRYLPAVRRLWPAFVLLIDGALLVVALYLPWQRVSVDFSAFNDQGGSVGALLHVFGGSNPLEGWDSGVAAAAALAALLLVGLSAVAFARPHLASRLPLGRCAFAAAYFEVAVAADTRSRGMLIFGGDESAAVDVHFAYGAYVGLAAAACVVLAASLLRRAELQEYRSPSAAGAVVLASGLLVTFLLPWERFPTQAENTGISAPAAQVAAVVAIFILGAWSPRAGYGAIVRPGLAVVAALFTVAAFSATTFPFDRAYGAWIAIGIATALVVFSLQGGIRRPDLERIPWTRLVLVAAGLLLVASLFLPWQEFCYPPEAFGPTAGKCVSPNGWVNESGTGAAVLAIVLIVSALARLRRAPPRAELAAGIALLVATLGFQLANGGPFGLDYGFWIGAVCTGFILVLAFVGLGRPVLDVRLAPIALCLTYLAISVPTWSGVLGFDAPRFFWFAPFSWITVVGALLALALIRLWFERRPDPRPLFLLPAVIAVLATLDLVRAETITWGGGIVLGLCALLALFAWAEHARALGQLQVPEILRVDRL